MSEQETSQTQDHPQRGGLSEATLRWIVSPEASKALSLAVQLLDEKDCDVLVNFSDQGSPHLVLGNDSEGFVLTPVSETTVASLSEVLKFWKKKQKSFPPGWRSVTLVFFATGEPTLEPEQLKQLQEGSVLGKKFSSVVLARSGRVMATEEPAGLLDHLEPVTVELFFERVREKSVKLNSFVDALEATKPWGTLLLVGLCVGIFLWLTLEGGPQNLLNLLRFGANYPALTLDQNQWWRLVGSCFLHGGWLHLVVNMYSLWVVGPTLEKFLGNFRYLSLYAVAGVSGSVASATLGSGVISVGASGALFGLFGACVVLGYRYKDRIPRPVRTKLAGGMVPAILFNLVYGFQAEGIDNWAHIGGLAGGVLGALLIRPKVFQKELPTLLRGLFIMLASALFLVEGFCLEKALRPFHLTDLPTREVTQRGWKAAIPSIFQAAEEGGFWKGPGVNLLVEVMEGRPPEEPEVLARWLGDQVGTEPKFVETRKVDQLTWLIFHSQDKVAGVYAVAERDGKSILVASFSSLDTAGENERLLSAVLKSVEPQE